MAAASAATQSEKEVCDNKLHVSLCTIIMQLCS